MKKIVGCVKRANNEYHMIEKGDVVGVGLSGGKDSILLLRALRHYQAFAPVSFQLKAITIDLGFPGFDTTPIEQLCHGLGVEWVLVKTQIGKVVFDERKEKNPCAMCAAMRRGRLNRTCQEHGVNKLALGHHGDDLIETWMMSMMYESRVHTFKPVTFQDRSGVTAIRPLICAMEKDVIDAAQRLQIQVCKNPCPASGNTKREQTKELLKKIEQESPGAASRMHHAILSFIH